jgi:hypothetical protein
MRVTGEEEKRRRGEEEKRRRGEEEKRRRGRGGDEKKWRRKRRKAFDGAIIRIEHQLSHGTKLTRLI